jgi:hypothetical protein
MKIDALTRKVDALSVDRSINAANTFSVDCCSICTSLMHLTQNCPSSPTFVECPMEQVNAFNDYRKQAQGPFSESYYPGWRNHPNFSWKQNQLMGQGGAPHHAQSQYPPALAYQAPTQVPASQSTLEDTLKSFMQSTSQAIAKIEVQTNQAIAKLEV